jgi:hypothetical protein
MCGIAHEFAHDWVVGFESAFGEVGPSADNNGVLTPPDTPSLYDLPHWNYSADKVPMPHEYFGNIPFTTAVGYFTHSDPDPVHDIPQTWKWLSQQISQEVKSFQQEIANLHQGPDQWRGTTANAILHTVQLSLPVSTMLSATANVMSVLSEAFSNTFQYARNHLLDSVKNYQADMGNAELGLFSTPDQVNREYSIFAQEVLTVFHQNMKAIADGNPSFDAEPTPLFDSATAGPSGHGSKGGSGHTGSSKGSSVPTGAGGLPALGGPGGGGGVPALGGAGGVPALGGAGGVPALGGAGGVPALGGVGAGGGGGAPALAGAGGGGGVPAPGGTGGGLGSSVGTPTNPSLDSAIAPMEAGAGALEAGASPLQSLLGQASRGGQGANPGAAASGPGNKSPLADGTLAKGLTSGAGGKASGGGAYGPIDKPAGAPATAAGATSDRTVAAGSRAGLSGAPQGAGGMGAPAAGAPGGSQHGGAAQGAPYQPSKVLRRKQNGEELIGDTEAVVPVLGEPAREEAAKPEAT